MAKNEEIEISKLIPYENNARTHSDEQLEYIVNSFNEFKAINPIIIDENNTILAGHGRVEAAKRAGLEKLPFRRVDWLTEEQKRAYILADNQISDKSGWDEELKNIELEDIELDMSLFGFDDIDLDFSFDYDDGRRSHLHHNVFENQEQQQYFTDNYFGIPVLDATQTTGDKFIRFCDWKEIEDPENYIAHFYYDDYKFIAAWRQPEKYIERLKQFKAVISPDFSLYTDFPRALQILSCYRRNWCGAYWAENGIDVIPDVVWGDAQSYDYCFEGIPKNSAVAVSSVGVKLDKDWNGSDGELFVAGYNEMIRRLNPTKILFYGDMIDGCGGNIIQIPSYYAEKRKLLNERAKAKKERYGQR